MLSWLTTAIVLIILGGWFVFLRPTQLGGPADYIVIRGSSMLPAYETGDLVIVTRGIYQVGDVVAYRVPDGEIGAGHIIIHRITGQRDGHWILQGDNNNAVDPWMPTNADVVGSAWLYVPKVGRALAAAHQPAVLGAIAAALVVMAMIWRQSPPADKPRPVRTRRVSRQPSRHPF
jgi:signal peptidase